MIPLLLAGIVFMAGPEWAEGDPEKVLASGTKRPLLVYVHAAWCGPCNQLEFDILATDKRHRLLEKAGGVMVDFDQPVGQRVTAKYRVLNLPTLLILDAKGQETGRVEGYSGEESWLSAVKTAMAGEQAIAILEQRLAEAPGDLDAQLRLAQARLAQGDIEPAKQALEVLMAKTGTIGGRAARVWGRYLVRVLKDGRRGSTHYAAMEKRFKDTEFRSEFLYWNAQAIALQGDMKRALALFDEWALRDPRGMDPLLSKAAFMIRHDVPADDISGVIITALSLDDEDAYAHYLLAEVRLRQGDRKNSMRAIQRAMKLKRSRALYRNFARRRLGMSVK